jgi:hypothetical protein
MKIINLILYSLNDPSYKEMYNILTKYLIFCGIEHYFYIYDENLSQEYLLEGNILYIRGLESFIPGILEKTLLAFKFFKDKKYDYIIRSNISTVIDFLQVYHHVKPDQFDYGGPLYYGGSYIDEKSGLSLEKNREHGKKHFVSGICIILSRRAINILVNNMDQILKYGIVDDVAIGIFLDDKEIVRKQIVTNDAKNAYYFNAENMKESIIAYRNYDLNRSNDVKRIKLLCNQLAEKITKFSHCLDHKII